VTPSWIQRGRGGATRAAGIRLCPKCRAPIITGLDADICAFTVRVDPTPLTPLGEAVAVLQGRTTYNLAGGPGRKELDPREAHHIEKPRRYPVLAEHRCNRPLDAFAAPAPKKERTVADDDTPPF
jgi:hypothetical protein